MFQTNGIDKSKHRFYVHKHFFKNCAIYETMWKNIVQMDRPQLTTWCVCIGCWIHKTTNTQLEYVTLTAFLPQQWLHRCGSIQGHRKRWTGFETAIT